MASKINGELIAPEGGAALGQQKPVVGLGPNGHRMLRQPAPFPAGQPQALMGQLRPGLEGQVTHRAEEGVVVAALALEKRQPAARPQAYRHAKKGARAPCESSSRSGCSTRTPGATVST